MIFSDLNPDASEPIYHSLELQFSTLRWGVLATPQEWQGCLSLAKVLQLGINLRPVYCRANRCFAIELGQMCGVASDVEAQRKGARKAASVSCLTKKHVRQRARQSPTSAMEVDAQARGLKKEEGDSARTDCRGNPSGRCVLTAGVPGDAAPTAWRRSGQGRR